MTWNIPNDTKEDSRLHKKQLEQLENNQKIEWSAQPDCYFDIDTSYYLNKNEQHVRAIMHWIGCPEDISTREFFLFLQATMVKYQLSNHSMQTH